MSFAKLQTSEWKQGLDLRKWRWKTKKVQKSYLRHFKAPLWDGKTKIHNKTLLIWGEQGPGDMIIWASCLTYFASIHSNLILECHPKLVNLFRLSFPEIKIRPERKNLEEVTEDFDIQVPMETLFGYACKSNFLIEEQQQYLFPDEERVLFWRKKLETLSSGPFIGISWKSPVMNLKRAKNYADLLSWRHILEHSDATFINLQSVNFDTDIAFFNKSFGCNIINFEELDLFNKLEDVAALSQALDQVVSIPTAAVHISTAVGTDTIIPTWKYSSWNNPLFNSRGPNIKFLYKETEEPWDRVMQQASKSLVSG